MKYAGVWNGLSEEDVEKMKEDINNLRKKATKEILKKSK